MSRRRRRSRRPSWWRELVSMGKRPRRQMKHAVSHPERFVRRDIPGAGIVRGITRRL